MELITLKIGYLTIKYNYAKPTITIMTDAIKAYLGVSEINLLSIMAHNCILHAKYSDVDTGKNMEIGGSIVCTNDTAKITIDEYHLQWENDSGEHVSTAAQLINDIELMYQDIGEIDTKELLLKVSKDIAPLLLEHAKKERSTLMKISENKIKELCQELETEIAWKDFSNEEYAGEAYVVVYKKDSCPSDERVMLNVERGGVNIYGHVWVDHYQAWIEEHKGELRICTERDMTPRGNQIS